MSSRFSTQGISEWNSDEGANRCAYVLTNLPVAIFGSVKSYNYYYNVYMSVFLALRLGYSDCLRCHVYL